MAFLSELYDITRELVVQNKIFDEESRKKFQSLYVEKSQRSTGRDNTQSVEPSSMSTSNSTPSNLQSSLQKKKVKRKSIEIKAPDVSATLPSSSKGTVCESGSQETSDSGNVNATYDIWVGNIAKSDTTSVEVKITKRGSKYAVAKTDLQQGDYVVELKGFILSEVEGKARLETKTVKDRNLVFINRSENQHWVDTTRVRDWPGCYVKPSTKNPNCILGEIKIHGLSKLVFYAASNINKGDLLRFRPKQYST